MPGNTTICNTFDHLPGTKGLGLEALWHNKFMMKSEPLGEIRQTWFTLFELSKLNCIKRSVSLFFLFTLACFTHQFGLSSLMPLMGDLNQSFTNCTTYLSMM